MRSGAKARFTILASFGPIGTCASATLAMGCCLLPSSLVSFFVSAGLAGLLALDLDVLIPLLYGLVGVSLVGVAWGCRRAHRWSPPALAVAGAVALLTPFHEALDMWLFYLLVFGGQVTLLTAAAFPVMQLPWNLTREERCQSRP